MDLKAEGLVLIVVFFLGAIVGRVTAEQANQAKPHITKALDLKFYTNGGEFHVRCADANNQATCELKGQETKP